MAKSKIKIGFFKTAVIWFRAVIALIGVALKKFKLENGYENTYDEYSDRSDQPERWYKKHYGK